MTDLDDDDAPPLEFTIPETLSGARLDKAMAALADGFSRSRLQGLIAAGAVRVKGGATLAEPKARVKAGQTLLLRPPPPEDAEPAPEAIPLTVVHEDSHVIVIDKPAGMVVHPAPGARSGTLVNALLHHCGDSLSGVNGVRRPGIVHRIDKDTTGLLVAAKTDAAHGALAEQFAAHSVTRAYLALVRGAPGPEDPRLRSVPGLSFEGGWGRIETNLDRHPTDRLRMAVRPKGRRAVTWFRVEARFGPAEKPLASLIRCRLETGRTHQIRVHMAHAGHPLIGDPVYGRARALPGWVPEGARDALTGFARQALHAETLGFRHVTGEFMEFSSNPPQDFTELRAQLQAIANI